MEQLLTILRAGQNARELVSFSSGLILRSADFKTRVYVEVSKSEDPSNPYLLAIYNLSHGDRNGDEPIELQHSNSGYIWIGKMKIDILIVSDNFDYARYQLSKMAERGLRITQIFRTNLLFATRKKMLFSPYH